MSLVLIVLGSLVALGWTALVVRLLSKMRSYRPIRPEPWPAGKPAVRIETIIPAYNEETEVAATLASLREQDYPELFLTIVNDQSTDRTGAILDQLAVVTPRLRVVHGNPRPAGWVGKTWAVHQGVHATTSEWILFVDADMRLHPSAVSTAFAEAERRGADMLSFVPRGECKTIAQTAIALTLGQVLSQLYPLDAVNDPARPEALAAGGFILIKRAAYDRLGGHEAVRSEIVEDIQLARRLKASGGRLVCLPASELAWTHLYGSLSDIWRGLRKNAYAGMEYRIHKYVFGVVFAALMAWMPWVCLVTSVVTSNTALAMIGVWGIVAQVVVSLPLTVFLHVSPLAGLTLPLGISLYIGIATSSVRHYYAGRILWKGRALQTSEIFAAPPVDQP